MWKAREAESAWKNGEQSDINAIQDLGNQVNDILNGVGTGETDTDNTSLTLQIKPGVTSWRNITIGNLQYAKITEVI